MSTIVVFGATGQLGRHVLTSLREHGVAASDVRAVGRNADRLAELESQGFATARADLDDAASVRTAVESADTVVLISASEPGKRLPQHKTVIDAAADAGVRRIVYTSLLGVPASDHTFAGEHRGTEEAIDASGIPATILRNGWYTENHAADFEAAREHGVISNSAGDGRIASAPRADYAEAIAVVASEDGHEDKAYELSGDQAWTFAEFAATAARVLGRDVEYRAVSQAEEASLLEEAGLDAGTAGFVAQLSADTSRGLLAATPGDLSRLIGRPTQSLEDTLRTW